MQPLCTRLKRHAVSVKFLSESIDRFRHCEFNLPWEATKVSARSASPPTHGSLISLLQLVDLLRRPRRLRSHDQLLASWSFVRSLLRFSFTCTRSRPFLYSCNSCLIIIFVAWQAMQLLFLSFYHLLKGSILLSMGSGQDFLRRDSLFEYFGSHFTCPLHLYSMPGRARIFHCQGCDCSPCDLCWRF